MLLHVPPHRCMGARTARPATMIPRRPSMMEVALMPRIPMTASGVVSLDSTNVALVVVQARPGPMIATEFVSLTTALASAAAQLWSMSAARVAARVQATVAGMARWFAMPLRVPPRRYTGARMARPATMIPQRPSMMAAAPMLRIPMTALALAFQATTAPVSVVVRPPTMSVGSVEGMAPPNIA